MDTKGGGDGGVMNWAIGIDMYTLMCIKLMTNKNLLYKKINKIQKLNKTKNCTELNRQIPSPPTQIYGCPDKLNQNPWCLCIFKPPQVILMFCQG